MTGRGSANAIDQVAAIAGMRGYGQQNHIRIERLPADPKAEIPAERALHVIHDFLEFPFPLRHPASPSPAETGSDVRRP